jgi:YfiR/HmsC-like
MARKLLLLAGLVSLGARLMMADPSLEYQVKAVCVLNAARFVSWPASAFSDIEAPLVIGILGDNPFGSTLQDVVNGATVRQRKIVVRRINIGEAAAGCHILFVSRSERDRLDSILSALRDASVLTVSELDGFAGNGGMIELTLDHGKIRFEVNQEASRRARLKIDSQFLLLARGAK